MFWNLLLLSILGILAVLEYGTKSGPSGGGVGGCLFVIPLLFLAGLGAVFHGTSSETVRSFCLKAVGLVFIWVAVMSYQVLLAKPLKRWADAKRSARK